MIFSDLVPGDRFIAFGKLWTKIDVDTARGHSTASIDLEAKGYGYIGDVICSFDKRDKVEFKPV